jgi:isocitrate dehydrogenase kinase/phosphatase
MNNNTNKPQYKVHNISTPPDINEQWYMVRETTSDNPTDNNLKPTNNLKAITIMVTHNFRKELKKELSIRDITIRDYIINLIKEDLGITE